MQRLVDSSALLGTPLALKERLARDGYLFLRGLLPRQRMEGLRARIGSVFRKAGWLAPGTVDTERVLLEGFHRGLYDKDYQAALQEIFRIQGVHELPHTRELLGLYEVLLGERPFVLPKYNVYVIFPVIESRLDTTTAPHQDHTFIQGSRETYTTWIPFHDCPRELGPVALVPGSHELGVLPEKLWPPALAGAATARQFPEEQWASEDFTLGDVLLFHSLTVHKALRNETKSLRVAGSFRFLPASEPVCVRQLDRDEQSVVRLPWAEIYAGFQDFPHAYYWRQPTMRTVPYDESLGESTDLLALEAGRRGKKIALPRLIRIIRSSHDPAKVEEAKRLYEVLRSKHEPSGP